MRTGIKYVWPIMICILLMACTVHIKPEKFDVDPKFMKGLSGNGAIRVVVPENADPKYPVEYTGTQTTHANVFVDLNDLYKNAKELIEEILVKNQIGVSSDSTRLIKFSISKVQWEVWAGGFSIGSYLEFDIETGDGYKKHYRVQDGSGVDVSRAVGGTISRAVEEIFQDEKIVAYIKS